MTQEIIGFAITAASIGFIHTVVGPDHYLPFIVLSKARKWSTLRTMWITALCGLGHVSSSIIIGIIGVSTGILVSEIEIVEDYRGSLAAWLFIIFGFIYFAWGIYRAIINKPHSHFHKHKDGDIHEHKHSHGGGHDHVHEKKITPWVLFVIFVLGPCEVLVFQFILPFKEGGVSTAELIFIIAIFSIVTIATMLVMVLLALYGMKMTRLGKLERYTHAIAGFTVLLCGIAIEFWGL